MSEVEHEVRNKRSAATAKKMNLSIFFIDNLLKRQFEYKIYLNSQAIYFSVNSV